MNILIDINHPGQVHLFRNTYKELIRSGHNVIVSLKKIPLAEKLLNLYDIYFYSIGSKSENIVGKAFNQLKYNWKLCKLFKKKHIAIALGSSISVDHAAFLSKTTALHFSDDDPDVVPLVVRYAHPFSDNILCPDVLSFPKHKHKVIRYSGYHELAYLHPNRFKPDLSVLSEVGLNEDDTFFVMRFNAFKAHHDKDVKGILLEDKIKLVNKLSKIGKVLITTEREIEPELKPYQIKISPEKIHHFLAFATIFIGDSQTMTSEAAVLGTPAIRSNTFVGRISYLEEQEKKYGLTYGFLPAQSKQMFEKIDELLSLPNLKEEWQKRRDKMLADKIDVTAFMVWFVENYPESARIMKENPDYQYRFK